MGTRQEAWWLLKQAAQEVFFGLRITLAFISYFSVPGIFFWLIVHAVPMSVGLVVAVLLVIILWTASIGWTCVVFFTPKIGIHLRWKIWSTDRIYYNAFERQIRYDFDIEALMENKWIGKFITPPGTPPWWEL